MASLLALALYMRIPFNESERLGVRVPIYERNYVNTDNFEIEPKWSVYRSHCSFLNTLCKTALKMIEQKHMNNDNVL